MGRATSGRQFTPLNIARAVVNPASAVSLLAKANPKASTPIAALLSAIPLPQTQIAAGVISGSPEPVLVRSGQMRVDIPEVIRKGGPMLPALIGTFARTALPGLARVGGTLMRGAGGVLGNPFVQQTGAAYLGSRLAARGRLDLPDVGYGGGNGGGRHMRVNRWGQLVPSRRRGSGISGPQIRTTMRVLKTIKKLYAKLPKQQSRGGGRAPWARKRY